MLTALWHSKHISWGPGLVAEAVAVVGKLTKMEIIFRYKISLDDLFVAMHEWLYSQTRFSG